MRQTRRMTRQDMPKYMKLKQEEKRNDEILVNYMNSRKSFVTSLRVRQTSKGVKIIRVRISV